MTHLFSSWADNWASKLLIALAFCIPLSTSASSVLAILVALLVCIDKSMRNSLLKLGKNPVVVAVLCYLLLHIVGLLWSENMAHGFHMIKKQWKLLLFPVFLTAAREEHITCYLYAFIGAISLLAGKAYLVWLGVITQSSGSGFITEGTFHVIYNPLLALASYIVLHDFLYKKVSRGIKYALLFLFLFLSINMFITVGRTGQVAYFLLMAILTFQYFRKDYKKAICAIILLLPLCAGSVYFVSPTFKSRVDVGIHEMIHYKSEKPTSVGYRVWFGINTLRLIQENLPLGVGTGDFTDEYRKINLQYSPNNPATDNPHNQYLLVLAQFGIVGILSLFSVFASQLAFASHSAGELTHLRWAFPFFFLLIMLGESYFMIYQTAFLFSLFSAFLYNSFECVEEFQE